MNPWKRARLEKARADVNRKALDKLTAEWQLLCKRQDETARLLHQAEDVIRDLQRLTRSTDTTRLLVELALAKDIRRALEKRLADAQRAQEVCDRDHAPLVRAWQQRAVVEDPWDGLDDGWADTDTASTEEK